MSDQALGLHIHVAEAIQLMIARPTFEEQMR
jgi:hypothetical protein